MDTVFACPFAFYLFIYHFLYFLLSLYIRTLFMRKNLYILICYLYFFFILPIYAIFIHICKAPLAVFMPKELNILKLVAPMGKYDII